MPWQQNSTVDRSVPDLCQDLQAGCSHLLTCAGRAQSCSQAPEPSQAWELRVLWEGVLPPLTFLLGSRTRSQVGRAPEF